MTVLNDTPSQLESQQKPTSAEIFGMLAFIVSQTHDSAKRFNSIWIQTRAYLDRPEIREYLQNALHRAPHNAVSLPYERLACEKLAATPVTFLSKIQVIEPPAPKRLYKSKSKTKINAYLRIDPELARPAVALQDSAEFRMWAVIRDYIRQLAVQGIADNYITVKNLKIALKSHGISDNRETVRLLLKSGQGRYWNRDAGRIFIYNPKRVAAMLIRMAIDNGIPVSQDKPGARDWYIRVSGSLAEFQAHCYAAWIASNENPTIARQTLEGLFNRDKHTLQTWERLAKIKIVENYAQTKDVDDTRIPEHAVSGPMRESAEKTTLGYRWQRPNTYLAPKIREHGHKGQARKVRKAVNAVCSTELHPDSMAGAHPLGVRNFDTWKAFKAAYRRDSRRDVPLQAHTDYLYLGAVRVRRRGKLIGEWELMSALEPQTSAGDYEPQPTYKRVQYGNFF